MVNDQAAHSQAGDSSSAPKSPGPRLVERRTGRVVVARLEVADTFWRRFVGLQFRRLADDEGLLLRPCGSLHTCFMRMTIDVVQLDTEGNVLAVRRNVRPWRIVLAARGTTAILEVPAGTATLEPGDQVEVRGKDEE